ncbi:hypothetical protein MLD38_034798 [Melastoma candidum]|uniref:Uncharacterized protein n=1 Tax=Melastoma candidum TaxID=119954 RepID=A0ACB9MB66_9MYRT|nr:hypothetical protein MLD38_034798 [Melastoma candidum]
MDLHPSVDHRIKDAIETVLGLPSRSPSLDVMLQAYQESLSRLHQECSYLQSQLCDKDELISRAKAEAAMNAQAIKKFVEANRNLAAECADLLEQRDKLEMECSLYDHDREVLMEFGNEAEERARDAEARVCELEGEVQHLSVELQLQRHVQQHRGDDEVVRVRLIEDVLLEPIVSSLIDEGEVASAYAFLEANCSQESCEELLRRWDKLRPSTQKILALVAKLKKLENDKEQCRINLHKAEDEVKLFYRENSTLVEENRRLLLHYKRERTRSSSHSRSKSGASSKPNKRKLSNSANTPVKRIDFSDVDSPRHPLSPLQQNSPDNWIQ